MAAELGNVLVLGLGKTGVDVARYALPRAASVSVYGGLGAKEGPQTDALRGAGAHVVVGTEEVEGAFDLAVVSPGIPEHSRFFASARAHATEVIGEPEFAWRESPERWVAITGTNGKTTTTALTRELLRAGGLDAEAVGNIGTSVTSTLEGRGDACWFVAELSSYQLATTVRLHPRVAVLLNVTPDHLSWHGSMEGYAAAKERVFANLVASDLAVIGEGDAWCEAMVRRAERRGLRVCHLSPRDPGTPCAAFVDGGRLTVRLDGAIHTLAPVEALAIRGPHNVADALAACAVAVELGVDDVAISQEVVRFAALEHRIEPCGTVAHVRYVNDSKATNVDATLAALAAFEPGSVVLLLGGSDKGTDLAGLAAQVGASCRAVVCYGEAGPRMAKAMRADAQARGVAIAEASHMCDALERASEMALPGDTVLLSPACASFDEFSGFEERGKAFKAMVARRARALGEVE